MDDLTSGYNIADLFPLEPQETIMAAKAAAINTFFIIKSGF